MTDGVVHATVVRYETKPESADENATLVRNVFAQLNETKPDALQYLVVQLDDGVSFIHIAIHGDDNPLVTTPAFKEFTAAIGERCVSGPDAKRATVVGKYGVG